MGLSALVDLELPGELKEGHWFVFISADKKKAKILYWRGNGIALWQLRLEQESFKVDRTLIQNTTKLSWRDLGRLLDGLNIFAGEAHQNREPKRFA